MYKKHKQYRLPTHDYSKSGSYFITICTKNRIPYFGNIQNGIMCISDIGSVVYQIWKGIPDHFQNVVLDEFVVMPDHVHGIIRIINKPQNINTNGNGRNAIYRVPTIIATEPIKTIPSINPIQKINTEYVPNQFGPLRSGSLSSIIHSYKSAITRWCHQHGYDYFSWQPRYHDRIIRTQGELENVRKYIKNNPKNFELK